MNKELKPCPFCGGEAIVLQNNDGFYYVGCKNAECRGYVFYSDVHYFTKERTIEAWNTRKPIDKVVEQLEKEKTPNRSMSKTESILRRRNFEDAIEIVKGGAE